MRCGNSVLTPQAYNFNVFAALARCRVHLVAQLWVFILVTFYHLLLGQWEADSGKGGNDQAHQDADPQLQ